MFWGIGYWKPDAECMELKSHRGQNTLGWMIMFIQDPELRRAISWRKDAYHHHPHIHAFQGIQHILEFIYLTSFYYSRHNCTFYLEIYAG